MAGEQRDRPEGPPYCAGFAQVRDLELEAIAARWRQQGLPEVRTDDLTGVAVSGGGIRSASFSLGVIQKLALTGRVHGLHYLSTVSGGGYMGSSLTWYLSRMIAGEPCYGTEPDRFPLLGGAPAAERREERGSPDQRQEDAPPPDGRTIIDFIRQRSSYLLPGGGLGLLSAIGMVLRGMLVSLFAYFLLFTLLWLLLNWLGIPEWRVGGFHAIFLAAIAVLAAVPVSAIFYSLAGPLPVFEEAGYRGRRRYQKWVGIALTAALVLAIAGLWFELVTRWSDGERLVLDLQMPTAASAATLGGTLLGLGAKKLAESAPRLLNWLMPLLPPLALLLLLSGLGTLGWIAAKVLVGTGEILLPGELRLGPAGPIAFWAFLLFAVVYLFYANINLSGLHRFYRDRLMETFLPDLEDVRADRRSSMTSANEAELWKMFDPRCAGPYHLINANVVMLDSAKARYRSRRSDSFVLGPHYCGSEATGWARTDRWLADRGGHIIRPIGPMTLATAMAISGAAVNPNTGADGRGATKGGALSAILTILNVRLGYWASSPRRLEHAEGAPLGYPPNFIFPGLIQGIFGAGRTERSHWLELTDGGHFDNIGLYELVRRRVKTIYVIDGTEDEKTSFSSFANAAEKIYIDFNVRLKFADEDGFMRLMRGADADANPRNQAFRMAERGFAIGTVEYPATHDANGAAVPPLMGTIYYIKATLTKGLPEALYSYRANNEAFPWQSTADQFFDEQQFEAYRTLGFSLAAQLTERLRIDREQISPGPAST